MSRKVPTLLVRCFQKAAKNNQAFTWYQCSIDHNYPTSQPQATTAIFESTSNIFPLRKIESIALFHSEKALLRPRGHLLNCRFKYRFCYLFIFFTLLSFLGGRGGERVGQPGENQPEHCITQTIYNLHDLT